MRVCSLAFAAIIGFGLVGCGDDDGGNNQNDAGVNQNDASTNDDGGSNNNNNNNNNNSALVLGDLDGTFHYTSVTIPDGTSSYTLTRIATTVVVDGTNIDAMVRGYIELSATDDASGVADMRSALVGNHAIMELNNYENIGVSLEEPASKLLWHIDQNVVVFLYDYDGTVLTLTLDENDVRNQDQIGSAPEEMVLTRFTPTANELTGSWSYKSLTMDRGGNDVTVTDTCGAVGSHWERLSGTMTMNDRGYYFGQVLLSEYDNSSCNGSPTDTNATEFAGFNDVDETNKVLDLYQYMITQDQGVGAAYDYTLNGTTLTLDLDTIYPAGGGGGTQVILEKL